MSNDFTNEDWIEWCTTLKPSELKVLGYIKTLVADLERSPDKEFDLDLKQISTKLGIHPDTVSTALKNLDRMGKITLTINHATIKLKPDVPVSVPPSETPSQATEPPDQPSTADTKTSKPKGFGGLNRIDPEYREWLIQKARQLPKPPVLIDKWILANKDSPSLQQEFAEYKDRLSFSRAASRTTEQPLPSTSIPAAASDIEKARELAFGRKGRR